MNSFLTVRALMFAGDCFVGAALIMALALLAVRLFRQSASGRHLVWMIAFGALFALPIVSALVPPLTLFEFAAAPVHATPAVFETLRAAPPVSAGFDIDDMAAGLFALWGVGVLWFLLQNAVGVFGLRRLYRRSVQYCCNTVDLKTLTAGGRRWQLRLACSPGGVGPVTWGVFRPVVLLPKAAGLWPRERLEAVLLHELAHLRRYDSLTQALSLFVSALYWPNPLVWIGVRALRREAEIAADNAVLSSGMAPSAYAGELVALVAEFRAARAVGAGLFMAEKTTLEARVKSVLAKNQSRSGVSIMDIAKFACVGLVATALIAFARPSLADAPAVKSTPVAKTVVVADNQSTPAAPAAPASPKAPAAPAAIAAPAESVGNGGEDTENARETGEEANEAAREAAENAREAAEEAREQAQEIAKSFGPEFAAKINKIVADSLDDSRPTVRNAVAQSLAKNGMDKAKIDKIVADTDKAIKKQIKELRAKSE